MVSSLLIRRILIPQARVYSAQSGALSCTPPRPSSTHSDASLARTGTLYFNPPRSSSARSGASPSQTRALSCTPPRLSSVQAGGGSAQSGTFPSLLGSSC